jgi:hypothetical protein
MKSISFTLILLLLASCSSGNFSGVYSNPVVTAKAPADCPLVIPPTVTISNGTVTLQGQNFTASGTMDSQSRIVITGSEGRVFRGQIDPDQALRGRFQGPNCIYDVYWTRTS